MLGALVSNSNLVGVWAMKNETIFYVQLAYNNVESDVNYWNPLDTKIGAFG